MTPTNSHHSQMCALWEQVFINGAHNLASGGGHWKVPSGRVIQFAHTVCDWGCSHLSRCDIQDAFVTSFFKFKKKNKTKTFSTPPAPAPAVLLPDYCSSSWIEMYRALSSKEHSQLVMARQLGGKSMVLNGIFTIVYLNYQLRSEAIRALLGPSTCCNG